jgi:MFS family permease
MAAPRHVPWVPFRQSHRRTVGGCARLRRDAPPTGPRSATYSRTWLAKPAFTFGSILAALGPSRPFIVIGRPIGGLGGGGALIRVYRYVDPVCGRTTALSIVTVCIATTSSTGTSVGGVLTEFAAGDGRSPYQR